MVKQAFEILEEVTKVKPSAVHKLVYDSPTETLEPIYFFILDLMNDFGFDVEKLVDNFVSSPGSAHFGEMGQRASVMQQQGSKLLGDINTVMRSILNLVYDLREFKIRLQAYDDLESDDEFKRDAAKLSLKQTWLDKVDIQKGNSAIKQMAFAQGGNFATLIDAFLVAEDESLKRKDGSEIDLNEIVKRVVKSRITEFNHWLTYSESELRKRFEIERTYLRSQVDSLKLYSAWAKPYLTAAQQLTMSEGGREASLVKMFNTMLLQLTLIGKRNFGLDWDDELFGQNIPKSLKANSKKIYHEIILVDFNFRGVPQRTQQGYVAGGKTTVTYRGYALDNEQLQDFYDEFDKSDIIDVLSLVDGITKDSLNQLTEDLNFFLGDDKEEKEKKEKKKSRDTSNPFLALFGIYDKKDKPKKEKKEEDGGKVKLTAREAMIEKKFILPALKGSTAENTFKIFETYKKVHGMVAFP